MSFPKLARSIAYTRPSQLIERAKRIVRCRWHDAWPLRTTRAISGPTPVPAAYAPSPIFEPRRERTKIINDRPHAAFLNVTFSLSGQIDWSPPATPELARMNLHYMEYLEALNDIEFERIVLDWMHNNPVSRPGAWRIAWNSFVVSLRSVIWMQQLAKRRDYLPVRLVETMHISLAEQMRFLEQHLELDIGGNHLVKNAKALLWAGTYFSGADGERWRTVGLRILCDALDEQILADGLHYERSPAYHTQLFADLIECATLCEGQPRAQLIDTLKRMAVPLVDLTHPDGGPSLFNDGGLAMAYSTEACLRALTHLGVDCPAPQKVFAFTEAGYFGIRSTDSYIVVDCGALAPDHLPAHGHGDALALEWTVDARRFIVDAGVFEYERGPMRDVARSTRSHNTVTLDDCDQSEFWASFRVGRRARIRCESFKPLNSGFVLVGSHDGFRHLAGAPIHRRRITTRQQTLLIDDEISGGAGQMVHARLLLHPDVKVQRRKCSIVLRRENVTVVLRTSGDLEIVDYWWFPDFGIKVDTKQIVVTYPRAPSRGFIHLRRVPLSALPTSNQGA